MNPAAYLEGHSEIWPYFCCKASHFVAFRCWVAGTPINVLSSNFSYVLSVRGDF